MSVTPGQRLSHYRIVEKIGEGGMGVVYRAEDTKLRRYIALKVLPAHFVSDRDRRARFLREARTAAAVSHPNITTIHEVDEIDGMVFIAMELVEGETLRQLIRDRPLEIAVAVRLATEMAEGMAEAHRAEVIHRDLKPDNVIVTKAGRVKILDFGLAKLRHEGSEERRGDPSDRSTMTQELTLEGRILGTPAYMAPEQIRGDSVDSRADGFSFGATLYEMVTGQSPFQAPTLGGTLAAVLGKDPRPPTQWNDAVPAELERIIHRCLQKEPEARYQDTRELLADLRQLQGQRGSQPSHGGGVLEREKAKKATLRLLFAKPTVRIVGALVLVAVMALGTYEWLAGRIKPQQAGAPFQSMRMSGITGGQDIRKVVLSPDARHLAILREGDPSSRAGGKWNIKMRQLTTGSEVQVLPPQKAQIFDLSFSSDGERLFYHEADRSGANIVVFEIPAFGGDARKRMTNVDSPVGFSPDRRRFAFARELPNEDEGILATFDLTSGVEHVLATIKGPERLGVLRPAWSPDGSRVLSAVSSPKGGGRSRLVAFDAASGRGEQVGAEWIDPSIDSLTWLGDEAIALSARDVARGFMNQIWRLSWPEGEPQRITNDLNDYRCISGSIDGTMIAALRVSRTSNLWSVSAEGVSAPRQLTFGSSGADVIDGITPAPGGEIVFTAGDEAGLALWSMSADGGSRRKISTETHLVSFHPIALEGRSAVVFSALGADFVPHIWRIDLDGGNAVQLTQGTGELLRAVSPDDRSLIYLPTELPNDIWGISTDGVGPRKIAESTTIKYPFASGVDYSPDGAFILFMSMEGNSSLVQHVTPASGGGPIFVFRRPLDTDQVLWHPDGQGLTYIQGESTLMRRPISGGDATPLFSFREGRIKSYRWSPNGRMLVFQARDARGSNLWLWFAKGSSPPKPLTSFSAGEIIEFFWARDSRSVFFTQGVSNRDVVVFRGLR